MVVEGGEAKLVGGGTVRRFDHADRTPRVNKPPHQQCLLLRRLLLLRPRLTMPATINTGN